MTNSILNERFQGHYGLEYVRALLAKPNRVIKQDRKIIITPKKREMLKRELDARMRVRRRKADQKRQHIYK